MVITTDTTMLELRHGVKNRMAVGLGVVWGLGLGVVYD